MKVAFNRTTGEVIPDFQSQATEAVLVRNAVMNGVPAADVEVRDVSPEEYRRLQDVVFAEARKEAQKRREAIAARIPDLRARLGLTNDDDVEALRSLILQ